MKLFNLILKCFKKSFLNIIGIVALIVAKIWFANVYDSASTVSVLAQARDESTSSITDTLVKSRGFIEFIFNLVIVLIIFSAVYKLTKFFQEKKNENKD